MQTEMSCRYEEFLRRYWPDESSLPKHERLRQAITHSIVEGYWAPGDRLPTESEWAEATPCSLGTVQRALRNLVADGLIQRRRGSGTTVANLNHPILEPWHFLFRTADGGPEDLLTVHTRVIERKVSRDVGPWSGFLAQGEDAVVRIDRVVTIDGSLAVYAVFHALADRYPELVELPEAALDGANLHEVIAEHHHMPVHHIDQKLRVETAPKWIASRCRWPAGTVTSIVNVAAYSVDGRSMYHQDFYVPPSPFILDLGTRFKGQNRTAGEAGPA